MKTHTIPNIYIIGLILILSLLSSCSKSDSSTINEPEISFDFKGSHFEFKGEASGPSGTGAYVEKKIQLGGLGFYYNIFGVINSANNFIILMPIDSLKTINYHHIHSDGDAFILNGIPYSVLLDEDYLDIKITDYSNKVINGTFSGKLSTIISNSPFITKQELILNGQIKNLKMNYNY